ncbi:MAG: EamA family transporter [Burkholderiaceae bacterium]|nr:EamA family transporter [Burkholderiaceae bacterium]
MSPTALALVLVAAVVHASWNLVLKRAQSDAVCTAWAVAAGGALLLTPLALVLHGSAISGLGGLQWTAVAVSGVLHVVYFLVLQAGYRAGDLSIVYPVARGVGPLVSALAAIVLLEEAATTASIAGLCLIVAGTFTIAGGASILRGQWSGRTGAGLGWGALTGVFIAAYTVTDGWAVKALGVAPLLFYWLSDASRAVILAPWAVRRRAAMRAMLGRDWRPVLAVAVLSPISYILVLEAMTLAPISHVAPAREVSMLIAAFLGARVLSEGELWRRLAGASLIAAGVACLALSG